EADRYARLMMEALEARHTTFVGRGTVRSLRPGTHVDLLDAPREAAAGTPPDSAEPPRFAVREVTHIGINNLNAAPMATIARRLGAAELFHDDSLDDAPDHSRAAPLADAFTDPLGDSVHDPLGDSHFGTTDATARGEGAAPQRAPKSLNAAGLSEVLALAAARGYANSFDALPAHLPWRPRLTDDTGARLN
ncbi:contractile injection system protein, VgrG/Pvc8 family, partial [Denitromonas iodatirespirans]